MAVVEAGGPALIQAIASALESVTSQDARNWFAHCGYSFIEIAFSPIASTPRSRRHADRSGSALSSLRAVGAAFDFATSALRATSQQVCVAIRAQPIIDLKRLFADPEGSLTAGATT